MSTRKPFQELVAAYLFISEEYVSSSLEAKQSLMASGMEEPALMSSSEDYRGLKFRETASKVRLGVMENLLSMHKFGSISFEEPSVSDSVLSYLDRLFPVEAP